MPRKKSHTKHRMRCAIEELYDQLVEMKTNTLCSCNGTSHYPCARCEITRRETDDLLSAITAEYGF